MGPDEEAGKVSELQEVLDRQSKELLQMKERVVSLSSRVSELEEDLDTARKDLIKSEDMNTRLQRDIREVTPARTHIAAFSHIRSRHGKSVSKEMGVEFTWITIGLKDTQIVKVKNM